MEESISQGLANKIYERRKTAAYDLERIIKLETDESKIRAIIEQLCTEFIGSSERAARSASGGLIGLAAATIALGRASAKYLHLVIPAVLSCFASQDSRVRYYATESLYNIAKVAKGEVLTYFNEIFDALCRLSADSENSVKNGSELLDRLVKDIVSEKATSYISILHIPEQVDLKNKTTLPSLSQANQSFTCLSTAFSLERFIPLLSERLYVINPYTRTFLVSWISVLNSIPDLNLIVFLPDIIDGLMRFLSDTHQDVRIATSRLLDLFLEDIKKPIDNSSLKARLPEIDNYHNEDNKDKSSRLKTGVQRSAETVSGCDAEGEIADDDDDVASLFDSYVDFPKLILALQEHLNSAEEAIQLTAMRWFSSFFVICPRALLPFTPKLLSVVIPAISHESSALRRASRDVNEGLLQLIRNVIDGNLHKDSQLKDLESNSDIDELNFAQTVKSATKQLSSINVETKSSALGWLMELHRLTSVRIDSGRANDFLFKVRVTAEILPALLTTLSDTSEVVVKKDLELLAQISRNDDYFIQLMKDLLKLFSTDRNLLDTRGSLIIRQLSIHLNAEKIYRTIAENLEKDSDLDFVHVMVQHLNNNLLTAPELFDARKRLRQLNSLEGSSFFVGLYKSWCHNPIATFSLCLLAQAYEQASNLLQIIGDLEITVPILIQIDKLVHLLESPVFTYLRLQLLEPDKYPQLNKCLYGLMMLLPQTTAFHTLKNRLSSIAPLGIVQQNTRQTPANSRSKNINEPNWTELLTKFRSAQYKRGPFHIRRGATDKDKLT